MKTGLKEEIPPGGLREGFLFLYNTASPKKFIQGENAQAGIPNKSDSFYKRSTKQKVQIKNMNTLKEEIHAYWTDRAEAIQNTISRKWQTQDGACGKRSFCLSLIPSHFPEKEPGGAKGSGRGYRSGVFCPASCGSRISGNGGRCDRGDAEGGQTEYRKLAERITWKLSDAQKLDLGDDLFDVVLSRNVTWNLEDPGAAYQEWYRVLKPGGLMCNFDADWYGHLYDEKKRSGYEEDRRRVEEGNLEDYYTGTDIERMESIARRGSFKPIRNGRSGIWRLWRSSGIFSDRMRHRGLERGLDRGRDCQ